MYYAACILPPAIRETGAAIQATHAPVCTKTAAVYCFLVPRPKTPIYAQIVMTFVTKKQQQEYHACSSRIVREPDMKPTYHKQIDIYMSNRRPSKSASAVDKKDWRAYTRQVTWRRD
jgi:hypothetical protein